MWRRRDIYNVLDIAVRAHMEKAVKPPKPEPEGNRKKIRRDAPSRLTLILDTETTIDAAQSLRVGCYQLRDGDKLVEIGLFYPEDISPEDLTVLRAFAAQRSLRLMTLWEFNHKVFFRYGYEQFATITGFNLPFDLARLAFDHSAAKRHMRGGFSFELSTDRRMPRVRVKHLSPRASLIDFATPMGQLTGRGMRNRGFKVEHHSGFFVDVKTIAAALTSQSFSLKSLCEHLKTKTQKKDTEEHGGPFTAEYLDYLCTDVQATWECFEALRDEYASYGLSRPLHRIISEASVGKACLRQMGIRSLLEQQRDFPRELFGKVMCAYYGGRAEVRLRRTTAQVCYCDFKSMYPTVNTLMGLWRFVIADSLKWRDGTQEVRELLRTITADDLQRPETWPKLTAIVRLRPRGALLPVRAKYDGRVYTIGLNYLTADQGLWYTLADVIADKVLTGFEARIEEAIIFEPGEPQTALKPLDLFGLPEFRVDPYRDDVFRTTVNLRDGVRNDPAKQTEQQRIKIVSNATSYGIFIEVQRDELPEKELHHVWGPDGEIETEPTDAIEQPGRFFNAALGALITGAARLMLALAEQRTVEERLGWVFCDTDSLAIARPDGMDEAEFFKRCDRVIDWFRPLNPYAAEGSILKEEKVNFDLKTKQRRALYAWAISAKRYALFNIGEDGAPILRKASAHGLGQYRPPYEEADAPADIPAPCAPVGKIGVARWQYDLWFRIVSAGLAGKPDMVPLDWQDSFREPAVMRYGATCPEILGWFDRYNESRAYKDQVKPFNFLLAFLGRNGLWAEMREKLLRELPGKGRPRKDDSDLKPVSAYEKDHRKAKPFDRETAKDVSKSQLMTYAEALADYHLSGEWKFGNARPFDKGKTERRQVTAKSVKLIGKEANGVGEFGEVDLAAPPIVEYGHPIERHC